MPSGARRRAPWVATMAIAVGLLGWRAQAQVITAEAKERVDVLVASAYRAASTRFPCKIKSGGKPKFLRWQDVDKCLNGAARQVDWEVLARELDSVRSGLRRVSAPDFLSVVESALTTGALPYEQVLLVKDEAAFLPLTNSILKFVPDESLMDVPVVDRTGTHLGRFAGLYTSESRGELSGATNRITLFQYSNDRGENLAPAKPPPLLDSYGVPWTKVRKQKGFRLITGYLRLSD